MRALAAALGNPQEAFRCVLIAGTNGKGSVAQLLSSMMPEAAVSPSPNPGRLNERIRMEKEKISNKKLNRVFTEVKNAAPAAKVLFSPPTYFELVTAMAFLYFRDQVRF